MAKKNKPSEETSAAKNANEAAPQPERKQQVLQPYIALEIQASKQRITTLKTLGKLMPHVAKLDDDGKDQLIKMIEKSRAPAEATAESAS